MKTTNSTITLLLLVFFYNSSFAQKDSGCTKTYYSNKQLKQIVFSRGKDTIELKKYYRNGQIKDSVWLYLEGSREQLLGTGKSYHKNGKIASIETKREFKEGYILIRYRKNGTIERYVERPTGLTRFYNRKGELFREHDYHQLMEVEIPKKYKHGKHLDSTYFAKQIKSKTAYLVNNKVKRKIGPGNLVSIILKSDTNLISHCHIEGFSQDSIYFSKFDYDEKYERIIKTDVLKLDSVFAIGLNQLNTLFHSKHNTNRRNFGGLISQCTGALLLFTGSVMSPFFLFADAADLRLGGVICGAPVIIGIPLVYFGKYLFKTALPRKYEMSEWKLILKS